MNRVPLILDCDPGVDDAVALLFALGSVEEIDLLGITTVAGNVGVDHTSRNARIVRQLAGRPEVPIFAGCDRPLVRSPVAASHFHGESGLGTLDIFEPSAPLADTHAVTFIAETVLAAPPSTITLAITGPMTNVAMAMRLAPAIVPRLRQIVVMGGARSEGGNITPSAEYNIYADPHAAQIVFGSGCPVAVLGLDVTHQVRATATRVAAIRATGRAAALAAADLLAFSNRLDPNLASGGAPLHDPCTIAYLLRPQWFMSRPCAIGVETAAALTMGHTAVEFRATPGQVRHINWVVEADADAVFSLLTERLARL